MADYPRNCSLKFDTQALIYCQQNEDTHYFTIDTFDNFWDTLFIQENEKKMAKKNFTMTSELKYYEQFGDYVNYLDSENADFPGE